MLDQKLKQISLDYATKMYDNIIRAFHSPLVKLEGEEAKIDDKNNKEATIKFLAMHKYKILSTVQKPKRSKWEVVTGRQLKK
jgi:hypothetical protein